MLLRLRGNFQQQGGLLLAQDSVSLFAETDSSSLVLEGSTGKGSQQILPLEGRGQTLRAQQRAVRKASPCPVQQNPHPPATHSNA